MAKTFTYTFGTPSGNITITTGDTPQQVTTSDGLAYSGYAITGISGTFNGETITGLVGSGGLEGRDPAHQNEFFNNTIFTNAAQGVGDASFDGIDGDGIEFNTSAGNNYNVYQNTGSNTLAVDKNATSLSANTTPTSTNYNSVTCYCTGALIRVVRDDVEVDVTVENLTVGDIAVTASGARRPIRWIGSRVTDCRRFADPVDVMPVRIRAHALGDNRPVRDLLVSPGHHICLDLLGEVLVPASSLINGATIVQEDVDSITYWHVELDSHDILLAENLPAESYLDVGNRTFFADGAVVDLAALPDAEPESAPIGFCRPAYHEGPLVEAARLQIRRHAETLGWRLAEAAPWDSVHLEVDGAAIAPDIRGLSARFVLPADARAVVLVSPTSVPAHVGTGTDGRALGLCLGRLALDDGLEARAVDLNDPRLADGFHAAEVHDEGCVRWTAGRTPLPVELLEGMAGTVFLRVDLMKAPLPRWVAPDADAIAEIPHAAPRLKLVAAA